MAKLTAWLVTLVGALWTLHMLGWTATWGNPTTGAMGWLVGLSFLVIGVGKLMRNYQTGRKR